jgi:Uncharacterised protein family (UPF0236)
LRFFFGGWKKPKRFRSLADGGFSARARCDLSPDMTRKKGLRAFSKDELLKELARRHAEETYRDGMTMTDMELAVEQFKGATGDRGIEAMLRKLKPEKPTGKACPKCGKRVPVKTRDRERTVRSLSGPITFKRNYHYCEDCKYGFYPLDRFLNLPEEGELTSEMEKRVLDFAVNDVYGECAARWNLHYQQPISENLLRRVIARVGAQCEAADHGQLQEELKPAEAAAEVLVVETDGSLLPIRGPEPWKEAKVGVIYRHDREANRPVKQSARYVAVVNGLGEFAPVLEEALHVEKIDEVPLVVWVGDGAPCNWTLADQLAPDAVQILDWHHAVQHAVDCGKVLLDEDSPYLPLWQKRAEALLAEAPDAIIAELMECVPEAEKRRRNKADALQALDDLVRYYRGNSHRMKYRQLRAEGLPIGSGAVESAHRHVLQTRMKRAGQRWAMRNARRMARLRAAYRTAGAVGFYDAIRRAHRASLNPRAGRAHRNGFRYAHQGRRDPDRCARAASN